MDTPSSSSSSLDEASVAGLSIANSNHVVEDEQGNSDELIQVASLQNGEGVGTDSTAKKPDVLYCLRLQDYENEDQPPRTIYQAETWKGIRNGLPGAEVNQLDEGAAVLGFGVSADILDKTHKSGNSLATWKQEPVDFVFGIDAVLLKANEPYLEIHSGRLVEVLEHLMDCYPEKRGDSRVYESVLDSCFVDIMHFYAELKFYHEAYIKSVPEDDYTLRKSPEWTRILDVGDWGHRRIVDQVSQRLQFGDLDVAKPCDSATAYDIAVLLRFLAPSYRTRVVPALETLVLNMDPGIKYNDIWLLYKPGTMVYVTESDKPLACVVMAANYLKKSNRKDSYESEKKDRTVLDLWHLASDGTSFLRRQMTITIPRFEGSKLVRLLEAVPCELYDKFDSGARRHELRARGQKYIKLISETAAYREYTDDRLGYNGSVIVDPASYRQHKVEVTERSKSTVVEWLSNCSMPSELLRSVGWYLHGSGKLVEDRSVGGRFQDITKIDLSDYEAHRHIEDIYLLLPPTIEGFYLKTKKWIAMEVNHISNAPPVPKPNQLDNELVLLNDEDKESLRTVLRKGERRVALFSDFIKDKGEGKVFLLHGPPGTGKTLTVECVANDTNRPLLALTAADISLKEQSEANLRMWFTLAAKWDAILLIDEADLFLEQRREGDVDRNSLVTIFLRTMEYYQGVLFLTTNRPGHIDDSFVSRITVPIEYPELRPEVKRLIVDKLVRKFQQTGTILVDAKAKQHLIDNCIELNGRHIRNVLQNAALIAEINQRQRDGQASIPDIIKVELHHIDNALGRAKRFVKYVDEMHRKDEFTRARKRGDYHVESRPDTK